MLLSTHCPNFDLNKKGTMQIMQWLESVEDGIYLSRKLFFPIYLVDLGAWMHIN